MNFRNKHAKKNSIYIFAIFCLSVFMDVANAQPKMPTQKELDALDVELKKMPTPVQNAELTRIADEYQKKYEPLNSELDNLGRKIERSTQSPGFPLTKADVHAAIAMHKKIRAFYLDNLNAIAGWGRQSRRSSCERQAEQMKSYTKTVSDQWLAKSEALLLSTVEDRLYAFQYLASGGGMTFQPDLEPVSDPKYTVPFEMIGLNAVCSGYKEEYVPGTE